MPLAKRSYTFKEKNEPKNDFENKHPLTPLGKIKTRGRSFIGSKTPTRDKAQEDLPFLSPFLRSSVRLKSFRKRKMANRETEVDGSYNKKIFTGEKCKDVIEEKIEENIRMRDGIMKLITGCHDAKQAVDISKNLLTINSRVLSLMSSLQKKRSTSILKDYNKRQSKIGEQSGDKQPCLGEICISDIRIPLMWKADSHFKTKVGEPPTLLYHMFCLLKVGDQVYDTPLIQFDQIDTDVSFSHPYIFHDVAADFKLEVEIYYTVMHNPDNPVWTPIRSQKKSVYDSAPKYCLAAHAQLTVNDIKEGFLTSDFIMGSQGASATAVLGQVHDLPENPLALWGQFSCYLRAKPMCMLKDSVEGHLNIQTSNGSHPTWEKYFCRLRHCTVQGWKHFPEQKEAFTMEPGISIKIRKNMHIKLENSQFADQNVLIITSIDSEKEPVISFDTADELEKWKQALNQVIADSRAWKIACETPMQFEAGDSRKHHFLKSFNFYDQIHIDQNDVRPKSPRIAKKSSKQFSARTPEMLSKRSFYDQIIIPESKADVTDNSKDDEAGSKQIDIGKVAQHLENAAEKTEIDNVDMEERTVVEEDMNKVDSKQVSDEIPEVKSNAIETMTSESIETLSLDHSKHDQSEPHVNIDNELEAETVIENGMNEYDVGENEYCDINDPSNDIEMTESAAEIPLHSPPHSAVAEKEIIKTIDELVNEHETAEIKDSNYSCEKISVCEPSELREKKTTSQENTAESIESEANTILSSSLIEDVQLEAVEESSGLEEGKGSLKDFCNENLLTHESMNSVELEATKESSNLKEEGVEISEVQEDKGNLNDSCNEEILSHESMNNVELEATEGSSYLKEEAVEIPEVQEGKSNSNDSCNEEMLTHESMNNNNEIQDDEASSVQENDAEVNEPVEEDNDLSESQEKVKENSGEEKVDENSVERKESEQENSNDFNASAQESSETVEALSVDESSESDRIVVETLHPDCSKIKPDHNEEAHDASVVVIDPDEACQTVEASSVDESSESDRRIEIETLHPDCSETELDRNEEAHDSNMVVIEQDVASLVKENINNDNENQGSEQEHSTLSTSEESAKIQTDV